MTKSAEELAKDRAAARKAVNVAHGKLSCETYYLDPTITIQQCSEWADTLTELDAELGKDNQSSAFYGKIKDLVMRLKQDKEPKQPVVVPPPPQIQQVYYRNDNDAKIPPFDGQPCHYHQFEQLFECKYEKDPAYKDADRFLIFRNLIGEKGREMIIDLDPDAAGLAEAKRRLKEQFDDPYRIRQDIQKKVSKLPRIAGQQHVSALKTLLVTCEESLKVLINCGSSKEYINEIFFRLVTSKLPFDLLKCYSEETNNEQDTKRLIEFLRKKVKTIAYTNEMIGTSNSGSNKSNETRVSAFATTQTRPSCCLICKLPHRTIFCRSHNAQT